MNTSELITPQHLQKKAVIYVRQSTLHQVIVNQESLRLQYALEQRAQNLGWRPEDIEVIDADLGLTGASAQHRTGFQELVTKVTLGQAGIILSSEVTRLSRNCSDWYPLLDVCGYRGCLIADQDGVYDPGSTNGRLLLGLKGQLSELELHTIRARMTAGLLNKAHRGELALPLPIGLIRDAAHRVRDLTPIERSKIASIWFLRRFCASDRPARFWSFSTDMSSSCHDETALVIWCGKDRQWLPSCKSSKIQPMPEPSSTGAHVRCEVIQQPYTSLADPTPTGAVENPRQ
jgi:DNA invertase Pin-like site-specific DNA recombinase